jgi:hypothetical protein
VKNEINTRVLTSREQEVTPVEIIYMTPRPWALSAAACPTEAQPLLVPSSAPMTRVHQAQAQAELILAPTAAGSQGISGFTVKNIRMQHKGMDVRGVPPRSRPV